MNEELPENTDNTPVSGLREATCSAFAWARYNDATVNAMLCGNACHTEIIAVLAREKADLIKRIAEIVAHAPVKKPEPFANQKTNGPPTKYNGHTRCEKCGQTHWMHGSCPDP